ncbi:MAG: shikimate kinase [Candidatus Shikimatogenerans sp. JK-2022]|nr:shikimate kinase [Candidatus Shikimatogenerans bostrichidophilus]
MGSGKSYIGYLLSLLTNYRYFDLDDIIYKKYKININNFFKKYGENKFRLIENKILNLFLIKYKSYILSVGGGTPCYFNNINLMNLYATTIFLKINHKKLYYRLLKDNKNRPILNKINKINLYNFIKLHIYKRINFYNKSKYTININNMNFLETAYYIKKKFNI